MEETKEPFDAPGSPGFDEYCEVVFPLVLNRVYTYGIPGSLGGLVCPGTRVLAPLGKKREVGYVVGLVSEPQLPPGVEMKSILKALDAEPVITPAVLELVMLAAGYYLEPAGLFIKAALPPSLRGGSRPAEMKRVVVPGEGAENATLTKRQQELLDLLRSEGPLSRKELAQLGGFSSSIVKRLLQSGVLKEEDRAPEHLPPVSSPVPHKVETIHLTRGQGEAIETIAENLVSGGYRTFLLYGVTGSGKTEVYLQLCAAALKEGRGALVLVPEISLTPHYISRFRSRFADKVALLHSGLSVSERWREWERIRRGDAPVVVGTRSAVFAPLPAVGLVVVDEEHDTSYKQETRPRYNARDLAVWRGRLEGATVVLGSATPSLESYLNACNGKYAFVELAERVGNARLPEIVVVDMRHEKGPISRLLRETMEKAVERGENVLLLLNRRGYAPFLMCSLCGWLPRCPNCDISLTYHRSPPLLVCHHCGHTEAPMDTCPECRGEVRIMGRGTQRLAEDVAQLLPGRVVGRMDRDSSGGRGGVWRVLQKLENREMEVLVGTQMVAKGHHYPSITVGGVVFADMGLRMPDFRAPERTFQLLTQLAGRTGRGEKAGRVVIQTFLPSHYSIKWAKRQDFKGFAKEELKMRKAFGYPPFVHLTRVLFSGKSEEKVEMVACEVAASLDTSAQVEVLGPAPAPLNRLRGRVRWHLLLKSGSRVAVTRLLQKVPLRSKGVSIEIDRDPYSLM